ncbi:ChbG/HpnK family deacetylase [Candidatus Nomurabacteria bacterium]|uniref:ChbG/HpnK family deacetylase n=1 Tax=candidate division WWE3 bacterium TaxID=2053526 RepID=A0A955IW79_UNCKA|nr:ChbG/HpnK family deacetylase [candidate division WWE3 bacterium]MCB9823405.1 ChbG/HpnK family deacetylase [Candidatus Nomurabacteria bacterium]MCB9827687.1 ChbG/HpnK family deacetylase [Candidatus Nomurabacteria bacterium]HXK52553.1 ChbG/HpnK family deacetylase [bacterium]
MNTKITKKRVVFTLHDFGKSFSVNDGIVFAMNHAENIATQYSLLPNGIASNQAAQIARERTDLSFDLCFTFTDFKPIGKGYKTLTDSDGYFLKANTAQWDFSVLDNYNSYEIEKEIEEQYEWFLTNVGRKPTALTTQKSEHGDPKILIPITDLAKKENIPLRTPAWQWFSNYAAQSYVEDLGLTFSNSVFVATKDWKGEHGYSLEEDVDLLISDIKNTEGISEIVVLAGFVDQELFDMSSVSWQRGEYLNLLVRKPEILKRYATEFDIISYSKI